MRHESQRGFWPIEGASHYDVSREAIYVDDNIATFLDTDKQPILIASKGMGKTLLMRSKKKILEEHRDGHLIIPRGQEYDEPRIYGDISRKMLTSDDIKNIDFWSDIWKASILFSVLSHTHSHFSHGNRANSDDIHESFNINQLTNLFQQFSLQDKFISEVINDIRDSVDNTPSYYLSRILLLGLSNIGKLRRSGHILKSLSLGFIRSGVFVLIDAFDQTLTEVFPGNLEAWKSAQIGLILASHYLNTENHHIKVFASIRQEAFAGYSGQHRAVIKGKAILLEYEEEDLRKMFIKGLQQYTNFNTVEEFIGLNTIKNEVFNVDEDVFKYIYRHSSGTPRSVMYLGQVLSKQGLHSCEKDETSVKVKHVVNSLSAKHILDDYLKGQKSIFLKNLCSDESISEFLGLICSDVLNIRSMKAINIEFAKKRGIPESDSHPFCELYNIGLLGTHRSDPVTLNSVQSFKKPYDFEWKQAEIIRPDNIYFLHPALHADLIDRNPNYKVNKVCRERSGCLIGDGCKWPFKRVKELFPLVFISHSSLDKPFIRNNFLPSFDHKLSILCPYNIWYDEWNILAGQNIHQEVERGVQGSDIVLLFLSKNSLKSSWVETEWRRKHMSEIDNRNISVIAILIDDTSYDDVPEFLSTKKILRLSDPNSPDFDDKIQEVAKGVQSALDLESYTH
jgi:hypothetical protein